MLVKLLKDKMEGEKGKEKLKTTIRKRTGKETKWLKDTVIDVSDETGKKLIKNGEAEEVKVAPTAELVDAGEEK